MTLSEMKVEVSNLVAGGATLGSSTTPTATQVTGWLNDGIQYIIDHTTPELHIDLVRSVGDDGIGALWDMSEFSDPFYKEISLLVTDPVEGSTTKCPILSKQKVDLIYDNPLYGTYKSPIAWRLAENLWIRPTADKTCLLTYITSFTALSGDSDEPEIIEAFHPALVQYAVYSFYHQQQQIDLETKTLARCNQIITAVAHTNGGKAYVAQ